MGQTTLVQAFDVYPDAGDKNTRAKDAAFGTTQTWAPGNDGDVLLTNVEDNAHVVGADVGINSRMEVNAGPYLYTSDTPPPAPPVIINALQYGDGVAQILPFTDTMNNPDPVDGKSRLLHKKKYFVRGSDSSTGIPLSTGVKLTDAMIQAQLDLLLSPNPVISLVRGNGPVFEQLSGSNLHTDEIAAGFHGFTLRRQMANGTPCWEFKINTAFDLTNHPHAGQPYFYIALYGITPGPPLAYYRFIDDFIVPAGEAYVTLHLHIKLRSIRDGSTI